MLKKFAFAVILLAPIPLIALLGLYRFHVAISILYSATAAVIMCETIAGIFTRKDYKRVNVSATAIICAYLPNEADIILKTLAHFRTLPFDQVILAYNTPKPMPLIEGLIKELPYVEAVSVPGSTSKAENLNYVLDNDLIQSPHVALFDADHYPEEEAVNRAANWLNEGYDAVQGRCIIRNRGNWLTRLVAAEFDTVYRLLHLSRFNLSGTAIFGGSNGYWKTESLSKLRFRKVLTEDIDMSLRALAQGVRIAHDPNIVSTEEAPETISALWKQRVRWSHGWLEVTLWHTPKLLFSKHLNPWAKLYWAYNLVYREVFSFLSFSVVFVLGAYFVLGGDRNSPLFLWTTAFTLSSIFVCSAISKAFCDYKTMPYLFAVNVLATFPFTMAKSLITTQAWSRHLTKDQTWEATKRA